MQSYCDKRAKCNSNCSKFLIIFTFCWVIHNSLGVIAESSGGSSANGISTSAQNINHIIDYLLTLKRSQDEIFRKIDWITKAVEEKDHEDYKFRLKFSRKVHSLESKVLLMEEGFTQKVEEIVQRKLDEISERMNKAPLNSASVTDSHGSRGGGDDSAGLMNDNANNFQNQQPSLYLRYHHQQPHINQNQLRPHSQLPPYQNINGRGNWEYYEHPITHKRVRNGNLYGFVEPPTRDLPHISVVATAQPKMHTVTVPFENMNALSPDRSLAERNNGNNNDEVGISLRNGGKALVEPLDRNIEASRKKIDGIEEALIDLKENVTSIHRELSRSRANDNAELHRMLVANTKEISILHQKHQDMIRRVEHFTVEIERVAARREHSVNESLKEMSAELKKQVNSLKGYTKRQVQNITSMTSNLQQAPDKLKCAQTLLDELLLQLHPPKGRHSLSSSLQADLQIADQAQGSSSKDGDGDTPDDRGRFAKLLSYPFHSDSINDINSRVDATDDLTKELDLQRKEILELKLEMAKLNISQLLLKRTVDEETLKRRVRPRDCSEIRLLRNVSSGIYSIFPNKDDTSVNVFCDMITDGGGWTVIQRRGTNINSSNDTTAALVQPESALSFFRNWKEYEDGFGSLNGEFWLGLSTIASLSQLGIQELRVELTDWLGESGYANYQYFKVSNASDLYKLHISGYSGNVGDSLRRHNGMSFSTVDKDHDVDPWRHCAKTYYSGWWFYSCFESNLNGVYQDKENSSHAFGTGIIWQHWKGSYYSLKHVEMKIRNTFIGENLYGNI